MRLHYRFSQMAKILNKVEIKYVLFLLCLIPVMFSFVDSYSYIPSLETGIIEQSDELNIEFAKEIVDNYSYADLVTSFVLYANEFLSILFLLIGLFFGDAILKHSNNNSYYMIRNRISFTEYKLLMYKNVLKNLFVIEFILFILIYVISILIAGFGSNFLVLIQSLIPFIFTYAYTSLVLLLTLNLNYVIKNGYILKIIPFIYMYLPILISSIFYNVLGSLNMFYYLSYMSYVPSFRNITTDSSINIFSYFMGNLSETEIVYLFDYYYSPVFGYLILICLVVLTFNLGKGDDYHV